MDFESRPSCAPCSSARARFIADQVIPLEGDPRRDAARPDRGAAPRTGRTRPRGRPADAARLARARRPGPQPRRQGGGVRGSRLFAAGPDGAEHPRARRRQHAPDGGGGHAGAEGALAAAAGRGPHALLLRHDRARAGAGSDPSMLRPPPCRTATTTSSTAEVVHHRRRRAPTTPSSWRAWRTARRPCSWPTWTARASRSSARWTRWTAASPAATRVVRVRRPARAGRRRARRARPGVPLRAGAAGAGAADPLHALARPGAPRARHRDRTTRARGRPSASRWPSTRASASCWPTTRWTCTTARLHIWHTAWVLDQGEQGSFESSRAKVVCSEARLARGRPLRADPGRAGRDGARPSSCASSPTCAPSASTTARARCTAGAWRASWWQRRAAGGRDEQAKNEHSTCAVADYLRAQTCRGPMSRPAPADRRPFQPDLLRLRRDARWQAPRLRAAQEAARRAGASAHRSIASSA